MGLSVYWIFAVMLLDYSIKATMLVSRYRSRKWLVIPISPEKTLIPAAL